MKNISEKNWFYFFNSLSVFILMVSLLPTTTIAQRPFDPNNPPDLLGLNAARIWQETKPLRDFYEWLDWLESAKNAIDNQKPIPSSPDSVFAVKEVLSRLEKQKQYVIQMATTREPNFPTEPQRGESETSLRNTQRAQELYVQSLTSRIKVLDDYRKDLQLAYSLSKTASEQLNKLANAGFMFSEQLRIAAFDLNHTIPNAINAVRNDVDNGQKVLQSVTQKVEAKYREFDNKVNSYLQNPDRYFRDKTRQQIGEIGDRGRHFEPEHPRSGESESDRGITTTMSPSGLVTINSSIGAVETWIIPPSADIKRPPEIPSFVIPPDGELLLAAAFPDNFSRIIVRAMTKNNELAREFSFGGNCGWYEPARWKNVFGESVVITARAYSASESPIDLSSASVYDEVGILGWGYTPPVLPGGGVPDPSPERRNGTPHQAVLMFVRADTTNSIPSGKPTGADNASIELGATGNWLFVMAFPNLTTRVNFSAKSQGESNEQEFWHPRNAPLTGNSATGVFGNDFRNGDKLNTISFSGSVRGLDGNYRPLDWRAKRVNTGLWLYGAGFQLGATPNQNDAYRATMFVVSKGPCADNLNQRIN